MYALKHVNEQPCLPFHLKKINHQTKNGCKKRNDKNSEEFYPLFKIDDFLNCLTVTRFVEKTLLINSVIFLRFFRHAEFPFLCANYDFSNTILKDKTLERKIFMKGDLKIGVLEYMLEIVKK